jgi:hypothetical protein
MSMLWWNEIVAIHLLKFIRVFPGHDSIYSLRIYLEPSLRYLLCLSLVGTLLYQPTYVLCSRVSPQMMQMHVAFLLVGPRFYHVTCKTPWEVGSSKVISQP